MPKDRSNSSFSSSSSKASPYACNSKNKEQNRSRTTFQSVGDEREWKMARCVICMEHPHNAVLLQCSSHEKGCRPYMCDTSCRHSNCLDQFLKSFPPTKATDLRGSTSHSRSSKLLDQKLLCPLCRGQISGWMAVTEAARSFMNNKPRSCCLEACDFVGTYSELRKHSRLEHPSACPTAVDPMRQQEWMRMENERSLQDIFGDFGDELSDLSDLFPIDDFSSFLESDSEQPLLDFMAMDIDLELPFTFIDRPCPFGLDFPDHTSMAHTPEFSYQPRSREFNRSTSQFEDRARGYSSRRRNSNRGQPNP